MASGFSLKDQLFNLEKTRYLAGLFSAASPVFSAEAFERDVMSRLPALELKERIDWIATCLGAQLPQTLPDCAPILLRALPPPLDPSLSDDDFGDFIFAPLGELVVRLGSEKHLDLSLDVLEELTQRFSMEWAIRPFLNAHPTAVLNRLNEWAAHASYHVRRLVSEGTRPRLPWGMSVTLNLRDPLPLLDQLHADPTRYVTRSVANHLNDISKKEPELVLERLTHWQALQKQDSDELTWMTNHALRGLVKAGHPSAMKLLGFDPDAKVDARIRLTSDTPKIGEALDFTVQLAGAEAQKVLVDYRIHFLRPGGKTSVKTFKLKKTALSGGAATLTKTHKLKGDATTFSLVPGAHLLDVLVNGRVAASVPFHLIAQT